MKYEVGDKFFGTMVKNGRQIDDIYRGIITKVSKRKRSYYIVWTYENDDDDRQCWYTENWLINYMKNNGLKEDKPEVEPVKLDEGLFTI